MKLTPKQVQKRWSELLEMASLVRNNVVTLFHHSRQRIMGLKLSNPESAYDRATSSGSDREIRG
jgi:hypothetical protein